MVDGFPQFARPVIELMRRSCALAPA